MPYRMVATEVVSIAEAILWGEQHPDYGYAR